MSEHLGRFGVWISRKLGFKWCPYRPTLFRHGWVWCGRRTTCPICAAYGRTTEVN